MAGSILENRKRLSIAAHFDITGIDANDMILLREMIHERKAVAQQAESHLNGDQQLFTQFMTQLDWYNQKIKEILGLP